MIRGIVVFALLGVALASRSANQYIDNIITSLPNELRKFNLIPATLPPFNISLGNQSIPQANFINGNATGFVFVKRKSECQGPWMSNGELTINCTLSLYPITTSYDVILLDDKRVYSVRSIGHVAETLVHLYLAGRPQNFVGYVKQFQIQKLGLITPIFEGLPQPFFKNLNVLEKAYKSKVSIHLFNILQKEFVYALGHAMANKSMPKL